MKYDVFLSYSSCDEIAALQIANEFKKSGLSCFIAKQDIIPGDNWAERIVEALRDSNYFLIVLSPDAIRSKHVASELSMAFGEKCTVIPFILRECSPLPPEFEYRLTNTHYLDATHGDINDHIREAYDIIAGESVDTVDHIDHVDAVKAVKPKKHRRKKLLNLLWIIPVGILLLAFATLGIAGTIYAFLPENEPDTADIKLYELTIPEKYDYILPDMSSFKKGANAFLLIDHENDALALQNRNDYSITDLGKIPGNTVNVQYFDYHIDPNLNDSCIIDGVNNILFYYNEGSWESLSLGEFIGENEFLNYYISSTGIEKRLLSASYNDLRFPELFLTVYDKSAEKCVKALTFDSDESEKLHEIDISAWNISDLADFIVNKNNIYIAGFDKNMGIRIIDYSSNKYVDDPFSLLSDPNTETNADSDSPLFYSKDRKYVCIKCVREKQAAVFDLETRKMVWRHDIGDHDELFFTGTDEISYYNWKKDELYTKKLDEDGMPVSIMNKKDFEELLFEDNYENFLPQNIKYIYNTDVNKGVYIILASGKNEADGKFATKCVCIDKNGDLLAESASVAWNTSIDDLRGCEITVNENDILYCVTTERNEVYNAKFFYSKYSFDRNGISFF